MYVAYLDESGSHGDTRVLAMAAFATPAMEWARLEWDWKRLMQRMGVTSFHLVDCVHKVAEFDGWTQEESNAAIKDVVDLITRYRLHGIAAAVLLDDFDDVVVGRARQEVGSPWVLCFRDLVLAISERIDRLPREEWVAFICDLQQEFAGEAVRTYERCRDTPGWPNRNRLGSVQFGSRHEEVRLQVTDVLAYETFRHLDNTLYRGRSIRRSLDRLVHERTFFGRYYDREALTQLAAKWNIA